jgi:penicillin-binding protein 2
VSGQVDSPALRRLQHQQAPNLFPNTTYYAGDNVEMAFGQGETLVSPLQIAEAYATFANGGTRYAPQMTNEIVSPSGKVVTSIPPKVLGHVALPASTYQPMLAGFEGVTQNSNGTAAGAFAGFPFQKWNVAGKTGTATVATGDLTKAATAWFVGFGGPVGQSMRYVVAVEVNQGGYGAEAAAPVARQVYDYLLNHPVPPVATP